MLRQRSAIFACPPMACGSVRSIRELAAGPTAVFVARSSFQSNERIRNEVRRRASPGADTLPMLVAQLHTLPAGAMRDEVADRLSTRTIESLLVGPEKAELPRLLANPVDARQLWWIADALRAVGGPGWVQFHLRRRALMPDRQGNTAPGSRQAQAALLLVLEAPFRLTQ